MDSLTSARMLNYVVKSAVPVNGRKKHTAGFVFSDPDFPTPHGEYMTFRFIHTAEHPGTKGLRRDSDNTLCISNISYSTETYP